MVFDVCFAVHSRSNDGKHRRTRRHSRYVTPDMSFVDIIVDYQTTKGVADPKLYREAIQSCVYTESMAVGLI